MRAFWILRAVVCGVFLGCVTSTPTRQGTDDAGATEVVRRYLEAFRSRNWMGCALLAHPQELSRIRRDFLPVFERDTSGQLAQRVLGVPAQMRVATMDSVDLAGRLFGFFVQVMSPGTAFSVFQSPEVVGSLAKGVDSTIVVYRFRLPNDSLPLRSWQTKLVRRYGSEWRIDMLADFSGMLRDLGGRR